MSATARVWDAFLTPRDREHLSRFPRRPVGFGSTPALLLVDNYRGAVGDRRLPLLESVREWPAAMGEEAWDAVEAQARVLAACRDLGVPVVHATGLGPDPMPGWNAAIHAGDRRGRLPLGDPRPAEFHRIVEPVAPTPEEVVIRKASPSAFHGTALAGLLSYLGVDTLLVGGEATSGCVRATVVDAASLRLRVVVMEECVYDRHQAAHAINLFDMHHKYADVLSVTEVLGWLRNRGSRRSPTQEVS